MDTKIIYKCTYIYNTIPGQQRSFKKKIHKNTNPFDLVTTGQVWDPCHRPWISKPQSQLYALNHCTIPGTPQRSPKLFLFLERQNRTDVSLGLFWTDEGRDSPVNQQVQQWGTSPASCFLGCEVFIDVPVSTSCDLSSSGISPNKCLPTVQGADATEDEE